MLSRIGLKAAAVEEDSGELRDKPHAGCPINEW
jgi:hypothetical protein